MRPESIDSKMEETIFKVGHWMRSARCKYHYVDDAGENDYTKLGEDAVNHFNFEDGSDEYDMCYELAVDILDE